jgi:hypothetical protein
MVCHQLAADWLWLGLVAPSDPAWDRGARALVALAPDGPLGAAAARAVGVTDPALRANVYADLVQTCAFQTCAICHGGETSP